MALENTDGARPIRFGIMCHGPTFAAWEAACIRELLAVPGVSPELLIVDDRPPPAVGRKERLRGLLDPKTLLWRLYQRLVLNRRSRSTRPVDLSAELADVPILRCRPIQSGKWVQRFQPEVVDQIRAHDLDFVLRFAFNILKGDVLNCARHGVWSFHHGDPDKYRGQPPGFWEIYSRDPVIGTVLQRLTEKLDAGVMLHRGWFRTDPASYPRSRDAIFMGATDWPARLCRQIQAGVTDMLDAPPHVGAAPIYFAPNSWQMLRFGLITIAAVMRTQWHSLFRAQQWSIGVIDAPVAKVAGLDGTPARATVWASEPRGRFLADPFAVAEREGLTILAEDYDWAAERGHISQLRYCQGRFSAPEVAISTDWHLSYPFLMTIDGVLHSVPEMGEARRVDLYRHSDTGWAKAASLIAGEPIIDPTIFRHDGRWWLLGTRAEDNQPNLKLFAWHADDLSGPWTPHLANPLKTDVRGSRPAGPLFVFNGQLYRPAQDCSTGYGAAIVVHRISALTPNRFTEEEVARIAPDPLGPYPTGLHTLCGAGDKTIIDGSRWSFQPAAFLSEIRAKTRRFARR
jgi:hypothetical protein